MKLRVSKKKVYKCGTCAKELSSNQTLKQHISIHNGLKPLKCSYPDCNASFAHASQLSSHRVKHYADEPNRLDFKSIKQFIFLFLEVFETQENRKFNKTGGPYKQNDAILPVIKLVNSDKDFKLPLHEDLKNFIFSK